MRVIAFVGIVCIALLGIWLWAFGGAADVARWAAAGQAETQRAMAGYLRALKRSEPGALSSLMLLCFAYGFFHAAGPGHGKLVIGGYGLAARVTAFKLSGLALASSLAQAATAVVLVGAGVLVFGWTRSQMTDVADEWLAPVSTGAIALVGIWLLWRGIKALRRTSANSQTHDHSHGHSHDHDCGPSHDHGHGQRACSTCGHVHGPSPEEAAAVSNWKDAVAVVGAVALRPCTGALFLLIITWSMGIFSAGVLGAFVMGLGTASVTVAVALCAVLFRTQVLTQLSESTALARASGALQCAAGALIAILASQMTLAALT